MTINRLGAAEYAAIGNYPSRHNARELKLAQTLLESKNLTDTFDQACVVSNMDNTDGTVYTGATGETVALSSGKATYEVHQAAVASAAVITPYQGSGGLYLKPVAAADALELNNGITSRSRCAKTVGTDDDFYAQATIYIDDISDVTNLVFGWRKAEAYQADFNDYDEMAAINVGGGADGRFNIQTILNGAATSTTNTAKTAWIDLGTHTLKVLVKLNGACEFWIDDVQYTTAAFTFDAAEVIVPFCFLDTETGDPDVRISSWIVSKA